MEDNYQAFYYQYGDQYRPQMYTERGIIPHPPIPVVGTRAHMLMSMLQAAGAGGTTRPRTGAAIGAGTILT